MKKTTVLMFCAALAVLAGSAGAGEGVSVGEAAPEFTLNDTAGNAVSLSDSAGKIVVLEWFNPGCPFVQRHAKAGTMKNLAAKYAEKDVVWMAVSSNYNVEASASADFARANGLSYPILDDSAGTVGQLYGAATTPHLFVIDRSGKIAYMGAIDDDPRGNKGSAHTTNYVDVALGEVLAGQAVTTAETKPYGCSVKYKN